MSDSRPQGPLPKLLIGLTVVSGLVDAFSFLTIGVFVANMTGNIIFLGFALAGVGHVSVADSSVALAAFTVGAALGGRLSAKHPLHRGHLLAATTALQALLTFGTAVLAETIGFEHRPARLTLITVLAFAMGGQNAMVRRLAVPDLTTTVLTRTLTGLVADASPRSVRARRAAALLAMLGGALAGGALLKWAAVPAPLWLAGVLLLGCAAAGHIAARDPRSAAWK